MTDKELEALAEWAKPDRPTNDYAGAVASLAAVGAPPGKRLAVARLLEERKRLLDALRPFAEGADSMTYMRAMQEAGLYDAAKQTRAAAGAIRFAEEAANP